LDSQSSSVYSLQIVDWLPQRAARMSLFVVCSIPWVFGYEVCEDSRRFKVAELASSA